ncbi:anti-anti-sigma factor [Gammaproteobacteria bacterium MOLA455]|nr:anti-anti-sigma factor [Gammaproteobacteria bacterium MOLA455]
MSAGKIFVSDEQGNYLIKFVGDVRVTLCGSLNHYMETIFGSHDVNKVVVDMLEAEGLDSTTLGLLAKLGLHCRKQYGIDVQVFCQNPSILRTLDCMGFDELFDIFQDVPEISAKLQSITSVNSEVDEIRKQVLEAHKLLVQLNPKNSSEFIDLIRALETGD